jgi:hypothetical protein
LKEESSICIPIGGLAVRYFQPANELNFTSYLEKIRRTIVSQSDFTKVGGYHCERVAVSFTACD